jgi:hypothetical protein
MSSALARISAVSADAYDVELADGALAVCRVTDHDGIRLVRPEPDIFATGLADARTTANAVLHLRRTDSRSQLSRRAQARPGFPAATSRSAPPRP